MKKGAIELTDLGEGFYRYRMLAIIDPISKKYVFSKQDLKDLRSLIDTVLGEECAVCNQEWEGKQPIPLCEKHDEEILRQPLTEGEGECKRPECYARKVILTKEDPTMEEFIQKTNWEDYMF